VTCKPKAGVIINHSHKSSFRSGATGYNNEEMASFMFAGYLPLSLGEGGWFPIQGRQAFYQAKRGIWFLNSCELRRRVCFTKPGRSQDLSSPFRKKKNPGTRLRFAHLPVQVVH